MLSRRRRDNSKATKQPPATAGFLRKHCSHQPRLRQRGKHLDHEPLLATLSYSKHYVTLPPLRVCFRQGLAATAGHRALQALQHQHHQHGMCSFMCSLSNPADSATVCYMTLYISSTQPTNSSRTTNALPSRSLVRSPWLAHAAHDHPIHQPCKEQAGVAYNSGPRHTNCVPATACDRNSFTRHRWATCGKRGW